MTNNIVHFPQKDDPELEEFPEEKYEVLDAGSTDLRKESSTKSSLQNTPMDQVREDVQNLTKTQLTKRYPLTHSSWRNRKYHVKTNGGNWAEEFQEFSSFLLIMGPRPSENHSLDRIDNDNPDYGPGLCRWLDAKGQANNRSTTIFLTNFDGERKSLMEWAEETGLKPNTMRKHRRDDWSDVEIIAGTRNKPQKFDDDPVPWRGSDEEAFELEKLFLAVQERRSEPYANRYEAYIVYLGRKLHEACERVRRCTEGVSYIVPQHKWETEEGYYAQFEPLGEIDRIDEFRLECDHWHGLLTDIEQEYLEWRQFKPSRTLSKEDEKLLKFIKSRRPK